MRHRIAIPVLIVFCAAVWAAVAPAETKQSENIRVTFDADFAPRALPQNRPAPVSVEVSGRIATTDGSHPPPLRRLEVAIHRNGRLHTEGLPTCSAPILQSTTTKAALERCGNAKVGQGTFRADVLLGQEVSATGTILAFNSRSEGRQALVLHLFAAVPVRFTLVVPLEIAHPREGIFGTVLRAPIPRLGGGLGSITEIDLSIGRRYSFGGKRRSYVSAACSAPVGFEEVPFPFARGTFRFEEHRPVTETLTRICRVR